MRRKTQRLANCKGLTICTPLLVPFATCTCTAVMRPADLGATVLFVLRHGRSLANERSIIVSRLDNGLLAEYALAPAGVEQAAEAGKALLAWLSANGLAPTDVRIVASPFSRTVQTAQTAAAQLGLDASTVRTDDALRERFFGDELELRDHRCAKRRAQSAVWRACTSADHAAACTKAYGKTTRQARGPSLAATARASWTLPLGSKRCCSA